MSARPISAEDLLWIVCPICHKSLELQGESVRCRGCERRYSVVDGIPVLLAERTR